MNNPEKQDTRTLFLSYWLREVTYRAHSGRTRVGTKDYVKPKTMGGHSAKHGTYINSFHLCNGTQVGTTVIPFYK